MSREPEHNDPPDWAPDWAPNPDSIGYVQKSLATAFLIAAGLYISYHVLRGNGGYAFRAAAGKGGAS